MNKSNINVPSAGTEANSITTAQNQHVSQPNANTNVGRSKFLEKITIGQSDYSRKQMGNGTGWSWGVSDEYFLETIKAYEEAGYTVKFKTSLLRRIFAVGKYKVVAYK